MTERKLDGKVALITGGARGLGRGYALRLAGLGADIAIIDRNLKAANVYEFERQLLSADTVIAECEALGIRAMGMEVDLTDRDATEKAVGEIASRTRRTGRRERHARSSDHRATLGHARGNAHTRSRHQREDLYEHLYGRRPAY